MGFGPYVFEEWVSMYQNWVYRYRLPSLFRIQRENAANEQDGKDGGKQM